MLLGAMTKRVSIPLHSERTPHEQQHDSLFNNSYSLITHVHSVQKLITIIGKRGENEINIPQIISSFYFKLYNR